MKEKIAYIIETSKRILPFGDPVAELLINQKPLRERQQEALSELGFSIRYICREDEIAEESYPCIVLTDDLYLNGSVLREFVQLSQTVSDSTQCAVSADSAFSRIFLPFHSRESQGKIAFPLYYLRRPNTGELHYIVIDIGEHKVPFNIPSHMRGSAEIVMPLCLRPIIRIDHPADILWASVACLNVRFAEVQASFTRQLGLLLRARSLKPARVLKRMNRIGRGCDIHPTAWLEGAEIGENVHIGANVVIRMSNIGDGCDIGDGSVVKHSVVGSGSVLFDDLTLGFSVCYPETFLIHGPYHLSVFGRSSAMFATILGDFRVDGKPIRLDVNGELVPYPFPFIGSFIGHRTRVAGGCIIAPGRIIPNDLLIFPPPNAVLTSIDPDVPQGVPVYIQEGRLQDTSAKAPISSGHRDKE